MSKVRLQSSADSSDTATYSVQSHKLTIHKRYRRSDDGPLENPQKTPTLGGLVVKKLQQRRENFKESIITFLGKNQQLPLDKTPDYPVPYVLANLASKAYVDYEKKEYERDYEKRLLPKPEEELLQGWKLLTTAKNRDGYFGAAYWHPKHHQVVIAHRGTVPTDFGALWTDLKGIVFNNYVSQMSSAVTFSNQVATVLHEMAKNKKVHFQLFFTGHSLGGWLAQITTFSTKYLKKEGDKFILRKDDDQETYHAHTVVFDSPGSKPMLSKMIDDFDMRYAPSTELSALDITSYLSVPNLINTCNAHIGTIYRIFPDFQMNVLEKNTAYYNLVTHEMANIIKAFNSETGQVHTEAGLLKLHEVMDWPINEILKSKKEFNLLDLFFKLTRLPDIRRLSSGEEFNDVFKLEEDVTKYHPGATDNTFKIKINDDYRTVRYRTKPIDENKGYLNLFTQDERQFLERYHWLRQLSDFFKPEKLFSMVRDAALQRNIQEKLGQFEIVGDTIQCSNTNKLQTLVPYVKNLLWLFPRIKKEIKKQANPANIRGRVFQLETQSYLRGIEQNPVDFDSDNLNLKDFLNSNQQVWELRMLIGSSEMGFIKFCHTFQKLDEIDSSGYSKHFTALKLSRLLSVNILMSINKLLKSEEKHLLILTDDTHQVTSDDKKILKELFEIIKEKSSIKIILTTSKLENTPASVLRKIVKEIPNDSVKKYTEESMTWGELTVESQRKLLARDVKFQGNSIPLNSLIASVSQLEIEGKQFDDILENAPIEINNEPIHSGDLQATYAIEAGGKKAEACHIVDALKSEKVLFVVSGLNSETSEAALVDLLYSGSADNQRQALLRDINVKLQNKKIMLLDCYEGKDCLDKFDALCRDFYAGDSEYAKKEIHWLAVKNNQFIWKKSYDFDFYIPRRLKSYPQSEELPSSQNIDDEQFEQEIDKQPVVIVSAGPGTGKSTWLTQWTQKKLHSNWVIRFNLRDLQPTLKNMDSDNLSIESVSGFLAESAGADSPWQRLLLQHNLQHQTAKPLLLLWDGFDEIQDKENKGKALKLLEFIKDNTKSQLIITTSETDRESLEKELKPFSVTFEPLQGEIRERFLEKFWQARLSLIWGRAQCDEIFSNQEHSRFKRYITPLLRQVDAVLGQQTAHFIGVPLQLQLLAIGFQPGFEQFAQSDDAPLPSTHFESINLNELYQRFINAKYDLYLTEKARGTLLDKSSKEALKLTYTKAHRQIALHIVFSNEKALELLNNKENRDTLEDLAKIGIIQLINGNPLFVHQTLAEHYAADFLFAQMSKSTLRPSVKEFLLKNILTESRYQTIRTFLNSQLQEKPLSSEVLSAIGKFLAELWSIDSLQNKKPRETPFQTACEEGNGAIIDFLVKALERQPDTLKALVDAKYHQERGVLHYAAKSGYTAGIERLLISVKDRMDIKELIKRPDKEGYTPLHLAAKVGRGAFIRWLLPFLQKYKPTVEIKGIIEAPDNQGYTPLHLAAQQGQPEAVKALLENNANIKAMGGRDRWTPLDLAAQRGQLNTAKFLLEQGADVFARNNHDTVLHQAVSSDDLKVIELILKSIKSQSDNDPDKLFAAINAPDSEGDTPLMWAIEKGKVESTRVLLETEGIDISIKNHKGMKALHWAAKEKNWNIAVMLLNRGSDINDLGIDQRNPLEAHILPRQRAVELVKEVAEKIGQILESMDTESGPSCSSRRRRRRDLHCHEGEERGRVFPYEPLEGSVSVEQQRAARLQSQLALALAWGHRELTDKWLRYQRYLGDILDEGTVNQSPREQGLLRDHYQQAQQFFADNPKTGLLQGVTDDFSPAVGESVFLQNGQQSWVVFNAGERYQLYSPDFNYRQRFQTRVGVSWSELSGFIRAFFVWKSGSGESRPLVLTDPLPGKALAQLQAAPYWEPDTLAPDSVLLAREQAGLIEGIPARVVRELLRVNGQVVDSAALHADFFQTPGIQLRVEKLHSVLTELTEAQRQAVVQGVNKYHWSADSTLLETLSTEERPLLADYQQQVMHELKTADTLTPERLSEFSWQALNQAFDKHPDISPELKQQALTSVQEFHAKATQHAWAKGMATQTLFFLPDMIRAANTGQVGGLVGTAGMLAADGGINHLYGRLLERLAPTLSESRLGLLRKLPLTSPVFKALTVYSIVELTQQLHSLPPDSPQRQIIKHRLGEQYVTAGLMVAELFGFELGPLWIGLIAEQLIFEAITFRKEHQLDIPFWEAFIMSLGFEQDKLQHITEERQLVELNLATVDNINSQANPPYGWVLVKVPSLGPLTWQSLDEQEVPHNISAAINRQKVPFSFNPGSEIVGSNGFRRVSKFTTHVYPAYHAAVTTRGKLIGTQWERGIYYATVSSTVIQFAPIGHSCQEDNIFLEHPQGGANYRRIASVTGKNYPFCLPSTPVKISGPGLAALYANNHTAGGSPRNLYINFDPCEGDITLVFTPTGLEALDKMNQIFNPHYLNNASSRYQLTVQVGHKNYPESLIFPQDGGLLILRDGTQRVNSQYFITTDSRPFRIRDEATVTRVAFTATKAAGYVMGSNGPEIIQLQPLIDNATHSTVTPFFSTVWLKGPKKYLQLQLSGQQIAGVLRLSAEQVEVLSAQGQDAYHSAIVMSNHVASFVVTIVGHLRVTQGDITLYCVGETPQNTPAIRYAKLLSAPHRLLYQLELAALQPVLDTLSRPNAMEQQFSTPGFNYTWLPGVERAIVLKIIGPLKGQPAQLLLEQDRSTLSQLDEQQQLRIMAVDHYSQQATLDNQLVLQQVITGGNTTSLGVYQPAGDSAQDFQVVDSVYPQGPGDILWFQSPQGYPVLHRFASGQKMTLNGIDYQIADNRLYAIGAQTGIIDGDQLIRYRTPTRRVGIRLASSLSESQLSWDEWELTINQLTLRNLPEQTPIDLGGQAFPLRALKESVYRPRHHHRRDLPRAEPLTSGSARHQPWASTLFKEAATLLSGISWKWTTWGSTPTLTGQPAQPLQNNKITVDEYTSGHFQGLLQLLDLGVRQWTGQKYGQQPVIANGSWADACVQAATIIEEFHQTLQGAARACGVKLSMTQWLDEMTLRNQVAQKLYAGQPQAIEKLLQPVVQSLYQTLCSRATQKQADRLMAHWNRHNNQSVDISRLQQQWVSLPSPNNMTCPMTNKVDPLSIPQLPTRPLSRNHLT